MCHVSFSASLCQMDHGEIIKPELNSLPHPYLFYIKYTRYALNKASLSKSPTTVVSQQHLIKCANQNVRKIRRRALRR